jgi:hypothetical protein
VKSKTELVRETPKKKDFLQIDKKKFKENKKTKNLSFLGVFGKMKKEISHIYNASIII